jgi:hypothetical protein
LKAELYTDFDVFCRFGKYLYELVVVAAAEFLFSIAQQDCLLTLFAISDFVPDLPLTLFVQIVIKCLDSIKVNKGMLIEKGR